MQSSYQLVRVFDKENVAEGNQAAVFLSDSRITSTHNELISLSADIYKDKGIATSCFASELVSGQYEVQCFNKKSEIQCCGHGMIAAAKEIFIKNNLSKIIINKTISVSHNVDTLGHDVINLSLPRISSQVQPVPDWTKKSITIQDEKLIASDSAISEKEDGYLLLEFEPALQLKEFSGFLLNINDVCENTKRAIVVIQFNKESKTLYTRYFAPQYGVTEDIATGSVMRFVADYIENKYQCDKFDAHQCSKGGGYMKVKILTDEIIITSNASME